MWGCEDVRVWGCEDVKMRRCEDQKMWKCDVKMRSCEDEKMWRWEDEDVRMWRCEDVRMQRCEDEKMCWRCGNGKLWRCDVKMRRCEHEKMWRCEDAKMWGCEDVKMWRWEDVKMGRCEDVRMWRCEDEKVRRCEDEKMWKCDVKMRSCEDEKDVKMRRCEDVRMRRCENWRCDVKMWRCENVWQTSTIRRTLRSDALGNKRPAFQQEPNVWLQCPQCCNGLEVIGLAHEELETPEAVLGAGIEAWCYLAQQRKKQPARKVQGKPRGKPIHSICPYDLTTIFSVSFQNGSKCAAQHQLRPKILCCWSLEGTWQLSSIVFPKWQLWGSNPRPDGLAPEASTLDHSAELSWTPAWNEYNMAFLMPATFNGHLPFLRQCPYRLVVRTLCCGRDNPGSTRQPRFRLLVRALHRSMHVCLGQQSSSADLSSHWLNDPGRTRTYNPRLRRPMAYPLGRGAF